MNVAINRGSEESEPEEIEEEEMMEIPDETGV